MGPLVPEPVHGSPADLLPAPPDALIPEDRLPFESEGPWWRPGWQHVARVIAWRWVILLPALAIGIGGPYELIMDRAFMPMAAASFKLIVFSWGVIITIVAWGIRHAVAGRKDMFCIHCGYSVHGLGERGQCPECGRFFNVSMINEYRKDPHFFVQRHKALKNARPSVIFRAGTGPTANDGTR